MIDTEYITVGEDIFQVIRFLPLGYEVWNIGANMTPGYIPLCCVNTHQDFIGGRKIDTDTLRAIRYDDARNCLAERARSGLPNLNLHIQAEKWLEKYSNQRKEK